MGTGIPRINRSYLFALPNGNLGKYSWVGDDIDVKIFRKLGVWKPEEVETAHLQAKILGVIQPSGIGHWSELDHKTFWEWVDDYELHT